ncbi:MAG: PAS domain-containing protein, partial [Alphaproteobacteria bacterium]|nr:PAS domain-containing protein [Alphaproteobacteria bacterium]
MPEDKSATITLDEASERLGEASNCTALLETWLGWRGDQLVPTRRDILPEHLGSHLTATSMMEVEAPDRAIIRLTA